MTGDRHIELGKTGKKVSVIITSYNQSSYLVQAIESVLNQTVKAHEIIVADDCSTDDSREVIRGYESKYPGIVKGVFQQKNVGIPRNRNSALEKVTGDYVAILDGDDIFRSNKIEKELHSIQQSPGTHVIYSNIMIVDSNGTPIEIRDKEAQPSGYVFDYVAKGKFGLLRSMLIDFSLLKKVGFLDERFPKYDGYELTLRLAKESPFYYISEPLVDYRVHAESDSRKLSVEQHLRDLRGIYQKMQPLIAHLSKDNKGEIKKSWNRIFYEFEIEKAIAKESKSTAFLVSIRALTKGIIKKEELIMLGKWIFLSTFRKVLKSSKYR